ncbi:hypothetical protein [Streptomyces atroolivaceus]|uniref:hypothetical protein n=1 Tax=Streptomyces atroolivaceus TaxID=66869 RepID=UPI0034149076
MNASFGEAPAVSRSVSVRSAVSEILPLLRRAADEALLGFTDADLREQAEAIRSSARYVLRVRAT